MDDTLQTRVVFAKMMHGIAEDFGGTMSKESLSVRFAALEEYSIDQITKAGTWLLRNRDKTFPAVPTTKEFIDAIMNAMALPPHSKAEYEADKVLQTLKEYGRDAEPLFYDEITKYLMTSRWTFQRLDLMAVKDPGLVWWRKEFVAAYKDFVKNELAGIGLLALGHSDSKQLMDMASSSVKSLQGA